MKCIDNNIQRVRMRLGREMEIAGISTFIFGLLIHLMVYVNHLPAYSGLNLFLNKPAWHALEGRWFTAILALITSGVTLPFFLGIFSLVFWAVSFAIIVKLFGLKSYTSIVLASAIFISFPTVAAMNCYLYSAHVFAVGVFWACLGVYFFRENTVQNTKKNDVMGVLSLVVALATYQEVLSVAMLLIFCITVFEILDGKRIKKIWLQIGRYSFLILLSLGIYYFTFKAYLYLAHVDSYRDFSVTLKTIGKGIIKCFGGAYWFLGWGSVFSLPIGRIVIFLVFGFIICSISGIFLYKWKEYDNKFCRIIMLGGLGILCPIVASYAFVVSPDEARTYRRFLAYVIFFILPVIICEKYEDDYIELLTRNENRCRGIVQQGVAVLSLIMILFFGVVDNIAYMSSHLQYEREYSLVVRVVERIEATEGYEAGMPVIIMFNKPYDYLYGHTMESKLEEYIPGMEQHGWGFINDLTGFKNFTDQFIQTNMNIQWEKTDPEILKDMNKWPENNCTLIRDGKLYMWLT